MNCGKFRNLVSSWLDNEISAHDRSGVEAHLQSCTHCQQFTEQQRSLTTDLDQVFQTGRRTATIMADRVIAALTEESGQQTSIQSVTSFPADQAETDRKATLKVAVSYDSRRSAPHWMSLTLAMTVGFLLALIVFPPFTKSPLQAFPPTPLAESRPVNPPQKETADRGIATLVASTGRVEFDPGSGHWASPTEQVFQCDSESRIRTSDNSLCELVTMHGAIVRMDVDTEVRLLSPRKFQLQRGRLFCRSTDDSPIEVTSFDQTTKDTPPFPSSRCQGTEFVASKQPDGACCITPTRTEVALETSQGRHEIQPGESVTIVDGKIQRSGNDSSLLLSASWVHPLLTLKGHGNTEVENRVDELFARIGHSKMSILYERELRSLGEYCVLPLMRYVQSPISRQEHDRRILAMDVIADLVPTVALGELLPFLSDESPMVRYHAARALKRLTGMSQGRSPDRWRDPLTDCGDTIEAWNVWWRQNRDRLPVVHQQSGSFRTWQDRSKKL